LYSSKLFITKSLNITDISSPSAYRIFIELDWVKERAIEGHGKFCLPVKKLCYPGVGILNLGRLFEKIFKYFKIVKNIT